MNDSGTHPMPGTLLRMLGGVFAAAWIVSLTACGGAPQRAHSFYTLSAEQPAAEGAKMAPRAGVPALKVVVGRVSIPEVVDRPQLVLRVAPNRVEIADFHRWAEPLQSAIPRILASDLSLQLGTAAVTVAGQAGMVPDVRVTLEVRRFEATLDESVSIDALWSVAMNKGEARAGRSLIEERILMAGPSGVAAPPGIAVPPGVAAHPGVAAYSGVAAAYSQALARVARDIALAIGALQPNGQARQPAGPDPARAK